jgi:hypothetical protein
MTIRQAATRAGKSEGTIRSWCGTYFIGRHIGPGAWRVSKVCLEMFLDGDLSSMDLYLKGDRSSPSVVAYYERLGLGHLVKGGQA